MARLACQPAHQLWPDWETVGGCHRPFTGLGKCSAVAAGHRTGQFGNSTNGKVGHRGLQQGPGRWFRRPTWPRSNCNPPSSARLTNCPLAGALAQQQDQWRRRRAPQGDPAAWPSPGRGESHARSGFPARGALSSRRASGRLRATAADCFEADSRPLAGERRPVPPSRPGAIVGWPGWHGAVTCAVSAAPLAARRGSQAFARGGFCCRL